MERGRLGALCLVGVGFCKDASCGSSGRQKAVLRKLAANCIPYNKTPSCRLPNKNPPTQEITNPGLEQQPSIITNADSRSESFLSRYRLPVSCAQTAYPPNQESNTAAAPDFSCIPHRRARTPNNRPSNGQESKRSHSTKMETAQAGPYKRIRKCRFETPGRQLAHCTGANRPIPGSHRPADRWFSNADS